MSKENGCSTSKQFTKCCFVIIVTEQDFKCRLKIWNSDMKETLKKDDRPTKLLVQ